MGVLTITLNITFNHLADAFIQNNVQRKKLQKSLDLLSVAGMSHIVSGRDVFVTAELCIHCPLFDRGTPHMFLPCFNISVLKTYIIPVTYAVWCICIRAALTVKAEADNAVVPGRIMSNPTYVPSTSQIKLTLGVNPAVQNSLATAVREETLPVCASVFTVLLGPCFFSSSLTSFSLSVSLPFFFPLLLPILSSSLCDCK